MKSITVHSMTLHLSSRVRFLMVGIANTSIDFGVFLFLTADGVPPIFANYISTSLAICFSYVANQRFTFKPSIKVPSSRKQKVMNVALFLGITLTGLWILQPLIILVGHRSLSGIIGNDQFINIISKLGATGVTLVWNYLWYKRVIFKED
jgi:putative flippase GtrA